MMHLRDSEVETIIEGTEEILEKTGFTVHNQELLGIAKKAGAKVEETSGNIRVPRKLLRELLSLVPDSFTVKSIDGKETVIGDGKKYVTAIITDPWIVDYQTGKPRRPSLEDVRKHTIIAQFLDRVVQMSRMDFPVTDYTDRTSSYRALEEHLLHQNKHISFMPASLESYHQFKEIARILGGGRSIKESGILSIAVAVVSPLVLGGWNGELLLDSCRNNIPVTPTVCPMAGTTSPFNKAANVLQANAENIFIAALAQMVKPGTPFRYGFGPSVTDMSSGYDMYYTLDTVLWKYSSPRMARAYGIPSGVSCGGGMTCRYDVQTGAEGMLFMKAAYESGADLLNGIGSFCNAVGMSAEMMIIQTAWLDAVEYLHRGIGFEEYREALESIQKVGPGGNFLAEDLTLKNLRSEEFFQNEFFDMSGESGSGASMLERAHNRVEEITEGFVSPLPENIQESLKAYFREIYKKL